jgi:hypothetical protein
MLIPRDYGYPLFPSDLEIGKMIKDVFGTDPKGSGAIITQLAQSSGGTLAYLGSTGQRELYVGMLEIQMPYEVTAVYSRNYVMSIFNSNPCMIYNASFESSGGVPQIITKHYNLKIFNYLEIKATAGTGWGYARFFGKKFVF